MEDFRGVVAQLGERLNGIQEVRGSSPLSSILEEPPLLPGTYVVPLGSLQQEFFDAWNRVVFDRRWYRSVLGVTAVRITARRFKVG